MNRFNFPSLSVYHFFILSVAAGLLLSGCQPANIKPPPEPQVVVAPKPKDVSKHEFTLAGEQRIVGSLASIETKQGDTLPDIARHYGLGYKEMTIANRGVHPFMPQTGSKVTLPLRFILPDAQHKGIVLNLANMRLFYYPKKEPNTVYTYPVGVGRDGWNTPIGQTNIVAKKANPVWSVPPSIQREHALKGDPLPGVVRSGPENPLGKFAMPLGFNGYLIHGTNKPYGIGMQVSHGCVQLYPENIEVLFNKTAVGTPVRIVHQPYVAAWDKDMLYLEAHEPLDKWAGQRTQLKKAAIKEIKKLAAKNKAAVDWDKVDRTLARADGIPTPILAQSSEINEVVAAATELEHPGTFYGEPVVEDIKDTDWSILAATFDNELEAQQLAVILNHQGPPIPSRAVQQNNRYQVISGPFKNKKETMKVAQRIRVDLEMKVKPLKPAAEQQKL